MKEFSLQYLDAAITFSKVNNITMFIGKNLSSMKHRDRLQLQTINNNHKVLIFK